MSFEISEAGGPEGGTVLTVSGEIRDDAGFELLDRVRNAVERGSEVTLDLRGCVFLQPSHLTSILRLRRRLANEDGPELSLIAPSLAEPARPPPNQAVPGTSPGALTIESDMEGDTYVIVLTGELGLETFDRFELAFEAAMVSGAARIRLDIEALTFIDSTGLQSLMRAKRRTDASGRLRMTRGKGDVADLFRLTALDLVLPFE
jgi:anti-anti-sigma factor